MENPVSLQLSMASFGRFWVVFGGLVPGVLQTGVHRAQMDMNQIEKNNNSNNKRWFYILF